MDVWETIRIRCRRNGEKIKAVARDLGLAPNTVRAYLRKDTPPKRKPRADVKTLTRYQSHIDSLILSTPKITAARIGSYLRQNVDSDLVVDERACQVKPTCGSLCRYMRWDEPIFRIAVFAAKLSMLTIVP
jgi:hypothetical protein